MSVLLSWSPSLRPQPQPHFRSLLSHLNDSNSLYLLSLPYLVLPKTTLQITTNEIFLTNTFLATKLNSSHTELFQYLLPASTLYTVFIHNHSLCQECPVPLSVTKLFKTYPMPMFLCVLSRALPALINYLC